MLNRSSFLYAFALGILTSLISNSLSAGWWQLLVLAFFWRLVDRHHFHGGIHQAKLGWCFGFSYFCHSLWWIYVSLHDVGGMPFWMASGGVVLFAGFLALFPSLATWLGSRFYAQSYSALAWAGAWTLVEGLRGYVLTGFPWVGFGDTQVNGPFMGLIPIFGVLGATFATTWGAYKVGSAPGRLFLPLFSVGFAILLSSFFNGSSYTKPLGNMLEVRLLQGNFQQTLTDDEKVLIKQVDYYLGLLKEKSTDLVVAPETAITIPENYLPKNWSQDLAEFSKNTNTHILTGIIGFDHGQYANQAKGFSPNGNDYIYTKAHLVPFGEYTPPFFEWFVRAIQAPLSQFKKGTFDQDHFKVSRPNQPDIYAAIMICYEDVFGREIAARVRDKNQQPHLLINMTNLAWFGQTSAPYQQLRLAQLRSLETGLPTIRATNTGVTALIDEHGQVKSKLPIFTQDSLIGSIQPMTGHTPYVDFGDTPILLIAIFCLSIAWYQKKGFQSRQSRL
jgi:apolipoprotein N-acyltransferase